MDMAKTVTRMFNKTKNGMGKNMRHFLRRCQYDGE